MSRSSSELQSIVRFRFHDGDVAEFKRLSERCMEIVRTQDEGTLQYDTFFNEDESESVSYTHLTLPTILRV